MRRKLIVLTAAIATSLAIGAAPAMAHPITPPGLDGATATFAGGASPGHSLGLACAENVSEAIGFLDIPCTIGQGEG